MIRTIAAAALAVFLQPAAHVESLDWLEGHWRAEDTRMHNEVRFTEELWTDGIAGNMFGIGRTVRGDVTQAFEFTRIIEEGGKLVFIAQPNGGAPVRFPAISQGPREVAFENLANDYPQRVSYKREGNVLDATISMADGTRPMGWRYQLEPGR